MGFDTINREISETLSKDGLTPSAILTLVFIAGACRTSGKCDLHGSDFAAAIGQTPRGFRKIRDTLKNKGYITVKSGGYARGQKSATISITDKTIRLWLPIWGSFEELQFPKKRNYSSSKNGTTVPPQHNITKENKAPTGAHTRKGGCAPSVVYNEDGVPIL